MSLEDIDKKFDKVAQHIGQTKPSQPKQPVEPTEQETYEEKLEKKKVTGLLSVFENHLKSQLEANNKEQADEEFRTVELTTKEVIPTSNNTSEKVTEEEISSLIRFSKGPKKQTKPQTTVDQTVYQQRRYDEVNNIVDNIASAEDIKLSRNYQPSTQPKYTDSNPIIENNSTVDDKNVGLPPVNVTKSKDEPPPPAIPTESVQDNTSSISPDVIKHIEDHRNKKKQGELPENYIKEDKN